MLLKLDFSEQIGLAAILLLALSVPLQGATIVFSGVITQSTQDGTGPAVNNPALNFIIGGDDYSVAITFPGSAIPPVLSGPNLVFTDNTNAIVESAFTTESISVVPAGAVDDFSILACLSSGTSCGTGNQLTANFEIPAASLFSQNVPTTELDQPHPLDLLEDDGTTDIQGSITSYSYSSESVATPEPTPASLLAAALWALALTRLFISTR